MNRTGKNQAERRSHLPGGEQEALLSTKLTPPRLRGPLVEREALFARLDQALEQRVVLLSAPAGFGKTTLVRAWLDSRNSQARMPPVAWVTLDARENDPVRFWRYVLTSCQNFQPDLAVRSLEALHRLQQPFETMLTIFINELAAMPGRGILVLEDYHTITSSRVHETLTFLLDYMPESVSVILITRADPPLPLARWRVHHALFELRVPDLRFSTQETRGFLQQAFAFPPAPEVLHTLEERIEGWPAGLRLLTLALQGHRDPREIETMLATFSGSHQHILEYLVADVLNAQPETLQRFLLQTSSLTRLSGALCDALTGLHDSAHVLAQLDQANLFLYPLDAGAQWYRYHALFAEAMQHEARQRLSEDERLELYQKASLWYEEQGLPYDAIEAALAGRDFARVAKLMEHQMGSPWLGSEYYTLLRWSEQLPEEELEKHPRLCIVYASGLLYLSDRRAPATPAAMERPLQMAEKIWLAEENRAGLGEIEALRSAALLWQGDFTHSFARARRSLELLPANDFFWRGSNLITLGMAELFAGRPERAQQMLGEARLSSEAAGNFYAVRATQFILCQVHQLRGDLRLAAQIYQQLLKEAEKAQDFSDAGAACCGLGALAYEWNNFEAAREALSQALDVFQRFPDDENLVRATLTMARLQHFSGRTEDAQSALNALAAQMQRWPYLLYEIHACHTLLALARGDLVAAQQQFNSCVHYSDEAFYLQQASLAGLKARLLIAQGEIEEALKLLLIWQSEAQERGFTRKLVEILVLQALAHHARKESPQARQALRQALNLARPEGYQRLFLDEGPQVEALLRDLLPTIREEHLQVWVRTLVQAFIRESAEASSSNLSVADSQLIEPLSPQERRVLRLLAAGRSNPEIANELVVSINTIKTQVQSIYYKLGVNSRQEAREAARALKLV
jgi:LuxR family maltose regulon positive regulatory protein